MRRADREITDKGEILRVIGDCDVCRLAFSDGEYPYILPLNFGMEEKNGVLKFYFHGAKEGQKYEVMERSPRASFELDCKHELYFDEAKNMCSMAYESVIGKGVVTMVEDNEEKLHALRLILEHYGRKMEIPQAVAEKTAVFSLTVSTFTAKRRPLKHKA